MYFSISKKNSILFSCSKYFFFIYIYEAESLYNNSIMSEGVK